MLFWMYAPYYRDFRCSTNFRKMSKEGAVEQLKKKPFIIKGGAEYRYPLPHVAKLTRI
jgi:hypothetical protein